MLPGTFALLAVLRHTTPTLNFRSFLPLSTLDLDVTHVRKCTRPSPLYRTGKLGVGLGTRLDRLAELHPSKSDVHAASELAMTYQTQHSH